VVKIGPVPLNGNFSNHLVIRTLQIPHLLSVVGTSTDRCNGFTVVVINDFTYNDLRGNFAVRSRKPINALALSAGFVVSTWGWEVNASSLGSLVFTWEIHASVKFNTSNAFHIVVTSLTHACSVGLVGLVDVFTRFNAGPGVGHVSLAISIRLHQQYEVLENVWNSNCLNDWSVYIVSAEVDLHASDCLRSFDVVLA